MNISSDIDEFLDFYNLFAESKGLEGLKKEFLTAYNEQYEILQAVSLDTVWVMNFYLVDKDAARIRLTYSASHFRIFEENEEKAFIGRANRFIHWEAMKYFKNIGFLQYDLGGYAPGSKDPIINNINRFKDSFGGSMVTEADYQSWLLAIIRRLGNLKSKLRIWLQDY